MRCGTLPDGGNDKVTWKHGTDLLRPVGDVPQLRYWMFLLRLRGDIIEMYWWDVVDTYHWDVVGCFIWDLFERSWRRTDGTLLLRPLETSSQRFNKMSWRRTTEMSWRRSNVVGCFIWDVPAALLGRTERRRYDITTASCCRVGTWSTKAKVLIRFINYRCLLRTQSNIYDGALWQK